MFPHPAFKTAVIHKVRLYMDIENEGLSFAFNLSACTNI